MQADIGDPASRRRVLVTQAEPGRSTGPQRRGVSGPLALANMDTFTIYIPTSREIDGLSRWRGRLGELIQGGKGTKQDRTRERCFRSRVDARTLKWIERVEILMDMMNAHLNYHTRTSLAYATGCECSSKEGKSVSQSLLNES
jgi:hypothetical protein